MTDTERVQVRDGAAVWREIDGEVVLLALDSSTYLGLNTTGAVLWPVMLEGTTRTEMVDVLTSQFDVTPQQAAADVDAFVAACHERKLLAT